MSVKLLLRVLRLLQVQSTISEFGAHVLHINAQQAVQLLYSPPELLFGIGGFPIRSLVNGADSIYIYTTKQ